MRFAARRFLAAAVVVLTAGTAFAQTATSTLTGIVRDPSGAAVAGASVTARNEATGATRRLSTDEEGRYAFAGLAPGEYEVRVERSGFDAAVRGGVVLTVGGTAVHDVTLGLSQRAEDITASSPSSRWSRPRAPTSLAWWASARSSRCRTSAGTSWTS